MPLLRRRNLVCQQVVELVTDYLEGSLSASNRRRFEAHLRNCPACTEYVAQMRATIGLTARTGSDDIPTDDLTPEQEEGFAAMFRQWKGVEE